MKNVYNIKLTDEYIVHYITNTMVEGTIKSPFFIKFNERGLTSFPIKQFGCTTVFLPIFTDFEILFCAYSKLFLLNQLSL